MWLYRRRLRLKWTLCVSKEKNLKVRGKQKATTETFGTYDKESEFGELYTHGDITQNMRQAEGNGATPYLTIFSESMGVASDC